MDESTKPVDGEEQGMVEDDSTSGMSLTRRKALGVGAVALGGTALGGLASAGSARAASTQTAAVVKAGSFGKALTRCVTDAAFYGDAIKSPALITTTFPKISYAELEVLRECAILSGANVGAINKVRDAAISKASATDGAIVNSTGHFVAFVFPCCCCCCCKEVTINT